MYLVCTALYSKLKDLSPLNYKVMSRLPPIWIKSTIKSSKNILLKLRRAVKLHFTALACAHEDIYPK